MTFVSVVTAGGAGITSTDGLVLITLTSFTTASSSTTVVTPIVFETKSTTRSLRAGFRYRNREGQPFLRAGPHTESSNQPVACPIRPGAPRD